MNGSLPRNPLRSFTLVEILVAVAIVAILVAVLLPAMQQARTTSLRMKCASNLRQCGTAIHLWDADHDGFYIPAFANISTNGPGGVGASAWYRRFSSLVDYVGGPEALQRISYCPTSASPDAAASLAHQDYGYPYLANYDVMASSVTAPWIKETAVVRPASTVLLVDCKTGSGWISYGFSENSSFSRVGAPHGGRTSVLWCDNHVSLELTTNIFGNLRIAP